MERPSWDDYFINICRIVATRSTCLRRQVGAIVVKNKQILVTGYNGAPKGLKHCLEIGCLREQLNIPSGKQHELCRASHAEMNCIAQAAQHGISLQGGTLYCLNKPCSICMKLIINAGITEIVYVNDYPDDLTDKFIEESNIKVRKIKYNHICTCKDNK